MTGSAQQSSQYGLNMSQEASNWYNSFSSNIGGVGAQKNQTAAALSGAASGALSGAASGATIGSVVPGLGTAVGAVAGGVVGGVAGGVSGYYG
jgi:outer membrane lipoprotein SlyB